MYSLTVRDHVMIAHSLDRPEFGPAQRLHGATLVVETTWRRTELDELATVLDIGVAAGRLRDVLSGLDYQNLDDLDLFAGRLTTTETIATYIAEQLCASLDTSGFSSLEVTLREHPDAWASYTVELG